MLVRQSVGPVFVWTLESLNECCDAMHQNVGVALPRCLRRFRVFQYSFPSIGQVCARDSSLSHPIECTVNRLLCHLFEIIQAPCNAYSHIDFMKSHTFSLIVFHIIPNKFIYISTGEFRMYRTKNVFEFWCVFGRVLWNAADFHATQNQTETKHWLKPKWWIICEVQSKRTISNPFFLKWVNERA